MTTLILSTFQNCLQSKELTTASSYLIILQNLENPVHARQVSFHTFSSSTNMHFSIVLWPCDGVTKRSPCCSDVFTDFYIHHHYSFNHQRYTTALHHTTACHTIIHHQHHTTPQHATPYHITPQHAIALLDAALDSSMWDLARDLVRYLSAIGGCRHCLLLVVMGIVVVGGL